MATTADTRTVKLTMRGVGCEACLPPFREAFGTLQSAVVDFDMSDKTASITVPASVSNDVIMAAVGKLPEGKSATIVTDDL